jgi:hypothetical protein
MLTAAYLFILQQTNRSPQGSSVTICIGHHPIVGINRIGDRPQFFIIFHGSFLFGPAPFYLLDLRRLWKCFDQGPDFSFISVFLNLHFYRIFYNTSRVYLQWLQQENNEPVLMYKTFSYSLIFMCPVSAAGH